ncbi:hypothetical protein [Vreelandella sp. EE27]
MKHLTLKLHGTDPDKLPLASLSKYLGCLDKLYGGKEVKTLTEVEPGCACLKIAVDDSDYEEALQHVRQASEGKAARKYMDPYNQLLGQIEKDGYEGEFYAGKVRIVCLPSKKRSAHSSALSQKMASSVKGRLYSVGGKDDTIPVRIEDMEGKVVYGDTNQTLATALGKDLFKHIHAHGEGEWEQMEIGGDWQLRKIVIHSYDVIENLDPKSAFNKLRALGGIKLPNDKGVHTDILDNRS